MDFFFLSTGFLMVILGLVGSFLPVLPGHRQDGLACYCSTLQRAFLTIGIFYG